MKRFIICFFLCMLLCSCGVAGNKEFAISDQFRSASNSAVEVSGRPSVTGSAVSTISPISPQKVAPGIVIDETGKRRKLKLGNVNLKNAEMTFPIMDHPTNYAQVVNNHYYFLRADGKGNYTIYRDKGKVEGKFFLKEGIVVEFGLYEKKFYAIVEEVYGKDLGAQLVEIDLKRQTTKKLCYKDLKKGKEEAYCLTIYKGVYYCGYKNEEIGAFDLEKKRVITPPVSSVSGYLLDDKSYTYEVNSDKEVTIYSYDIRKHKKEKVLQFACKDKINEEEILVGLEIDNDYIYCVDCLIPRRGGNIMRLPRRVIKSRDRNWIFSDPWSSLFTHNKKFIFYVDGEGKIHRIDKKTQEDIVISNPDKIQPMDIQCTENGLYVQEFYYWVSMDYYAEHPDMYRDEFGADEEFADSCDLYYMDFDGKNVKRIWKEGV